jgi:hypothetical protein
LHEKVHFQTVAGGREITFREPLANVVFCGVLYGIGYSFFFLAVANLLFLRPLPIVGFLASLTWITLIVVSFITGWRSVGFRQHLVNLLENFTRNRFAELTSADSGESILCFGYKCGFTRHYILKLRSNGIKSVDWGPGQGNIAAKDNDWNVALWFDTASIVLDGRRDGLGIFIVGASGRKAEREAFGRDFIEFLKANRVRLTVPPVGLLGQLAEVVESLRPFGRIIVGKDEFLARPVQRMIEKGSKVVVEEIRGTSVFVRQATAPTKP